jgi:LemA protein
VLIYFLFFIILISLILIWISLTYTNFKKIKIKINEAESEIDAILRKKFDFLNKSINVIRGNIKIEKEILENIIKLRSRKLSNFDFDKELLNANAEFQNIKIEFSDLNKIEGFKKIDKSIKEIDEQLIGVKNYYNNNCTIFNKNVRMFPSNVVALFFKFRKYPLFENEKNDIAEL